eukprot:3134556-Rhodomonas_salina.1
MTITDSSGVRKGFYAVYNAPQSFEYGSCSSTTSARFSRVVGEVSASSCTFVIDHAATLHVMEGSGTV